MRGKAMGKFLEPYEDLRILIPAAAMFLIIFAIVFRTLKEMPLFPGPAGRVVVSFCVTALAMYGMDQVMIRSILMSYSAMGFAMLVGLAGLLLVVWIGLMVRSGRGRRDRE